MSLILQVSPQKGDIKHILRSIQTLPDSSLDIISQQGVTQCCIKRQMSSSGGSEVAQVKE